MNEEWICDDCGENASFECIECGYSYCEDCNPSHNRDDGEICDACVANGF